jgi:ACS family tartrate transporter-like MFS transporter
MQSAEENRPSALEQRTTRKVLWRIIPFVFALYVVSYIDRANIGYAALQMNRELGLSASAFGFAAGVFFIGYFLFEVPSNLALGRFGARIWIALILITWGVVAALSAFVHSALQLYVLRFLLGAAEAGFFPGVILYLTGWFRARDQATSVALFTAAIPVSYLLGAPLSTWIMDHASGFGLSGWRWMLLLEGVPALLGGIACYLFLTDTPGEAHWLTEDEKQWLGAELARDREERPHVRTLTTGQAIVAPQVLLLALIYFIYQAGSLGVGYWMPQIIASLSGRVSNFQIGLLAMAPYALATLAMIAWSAHSDRTGERQLHAALPLLVGAVALAATGLTRNPVTSLLLIAIVLAGLYAFKAPFWSLPGLFLSRSTVAISIASINSIGNLGGFAGPYLVGLAKGSSADPMRGLLFLSGLLLLAFLLTRFGRFAVRVPVATIAGVN